MRNKLLTRNEIPLHLRFNFCKGLCTFRAQMRNEMLLTQGKYKVQGNLIPCEHLVSHMSPKSALHKPYISHKNAELHLLREGFKKKIGQTWAFGRSWGGRVRGGLKSPTCYMVYSVGVKCAKKYSQTI